MGRIPDVQARRRLREVLYDPFTQRILSAIGVEPGWRCLDAGAGRGSIAAWLADRVGPSGQVVAVDVDLELLKTVPAAAFERRRHDLAKDGPVGRDFDLIHSRFVLEHLADRGRVLGELVDQLRPGGWIVIQDADFSPTARADCAPYAMAMAAFDAAMSARGTDYAWTLSLPDRLAAHDLIELDAVSETTWFPGGSDLARFWASNLDVMREQMFALDLIDEATYHAAIAILLDGGRWLPIIGVLAIRGRRAS